jgi:hypothetical protein
MRLVAAFDRYWFDPAPARRLALLRIVTGGFALYYLLFRFYDVLRVAELDRSQFAPVGFAWFLAEPLSTQVVAVLQLVAIAAAVLFVIGFAYRVAAPLLAVLFLCITSYRSSWGMVFHTENLIALHLVVLGAAPAADAIGLDARKHTADPAVAGCYGWPARAMSWLTVGAYVLAGLAKLKLAGVGWLDGDFLRNQIAYDNLRKIEIGGSHSALGVALVHYEVPFQVLAPLSFALELGAPVALLGWRPALAWAAGAWLFHVGVLVLMSIPFRYQLSLVAYASLFPLERCLDFLVERPRAHALLARLRRFQRQSEG